MGVAPGALGASETGLEITVCHYPAGDLEVETDRAPSVQLHLHQLGGRPLTHIRTIVGLIGAGTATSGLTVQAAYNHWYPTAERTHNSIAATLQMRRTSHG